ncbi:hypothetical protein [Umezawaea sp. Da 62-37]|uniref:hypothetical protein n=1 Tax=Umezawaea sp. Da 62-37 TaxID=3075927 RepID=UPI0028F6FEBE|nr:hypothetical protein [Umezawaea sp. Da 62-37]WNV91536.1 hypothetical protein RM788_25740 [Umezawaea sp. Da 62-37]
MNARTEWDEIVQRLLAGGQRPGCTTKRTTTRSLLPRDGRRAVPVALTVPATVSAASQPEVSA